MDVQWDAAGLVPAIVIDAATGEVLTLAYMNAQSLAKTEESGETWFWSRSRKALWHKGETSGNTQRVISLTADCDRDAVVVRVLPRGPACHTGARSCFSASAGGAVVELDRVLEQRAEQRPQGSYTTKLLADANLRIKKIGEESAELVHALASGDERRCAEEAADLLYHVGVALRARGVSLADVTRVLLSRASDGASSKSDKD
jgi:phosphoribosyl-ATP pyrophosphohydrolase/phosphoribosyl-AMP cyclohydrolase